jgi:eukaryotic-like serine/threonine-protein kinase
VAIETRDASGSPLSATSWGGESRAGTNINDKWHLDALLGRGGTGEVYSATHRNGGRAAIKILHAELAGNPIIRSRFLSEGYAVNALGHPSVVRVLDDDVTSDGLVYLVMELLSGETLQYRTEQRGGRLDVHEVLDVAGEVLDVLSVAHAKGILHRDLKPENLFRTDSGILKVLDFGLAKLGAGMGHTSRQPTLGGWTMGTPGFMPPEQVRGDWSNVGVTSDLWALGATMQFLLLGLSVHDTGDTNQQLALTASLPAPSVSVCSPRLPSVVVSLVDRALSFDRAARFQSAHEMRHAVTLAQRALSGTKTPEPVRSPRSPSKPQRLPATLDSPSVLSGVGASSSRHLELPQLAFAARTALPATTGARHSMIVHHPSSELVAPVEIAPDTYWVGKRDPRSIFHSNPYLRVFRGAPEGGAAAQFNLLIDPGSSSDFAVVSSKVATLIGGMNKLSALFINHQDPDVGSSSQVISARYAPGAAILCSEATWRLVMHLNLPKDRFVNTDRYPHGCRLPTGHAIMPVPSPFCHFRGAVMLYDPTTRVLFSGDLFGGLTVEGAVGLWADESDWSGMRAFHQTYMPSTRALANVIQQIRALDPPVEIIAPQHGRLIRGAMIQRILERVSTLPVGLDVIAEEGSGPDILTAWNSVMRRVVETAKLLLGAAALEILRESDELADTLRVDGQTVTVSSLGRWTVGAAVEVLTAGQAPEVANPIKLEAILAAEQLDLPCPDLRIEDIEGAALSGR